MTAEGACDRKVWILILMFLLIFPDRNSTKRRCLANIPPKSSRYRGIHVIYPDCHSVCSQVNFDCRNETEKNSKWLHLKSLRSRRTVPDRRELLVLLHLRQNWSADGRKSVQMPRNIRLLAIDQEMLLFVASHADTGNFIFIPLRRSYWMKMIILGSAIKSDWRQCLSCLHKTWSFSVIENSMWSYSSQARANK